MSLNIDWVSLNIEPLMMIILKVWTCTGLHPLFPLPQLEVQSPKIKMIKSIRATHAQVHACIYACTDGGTYTHTCTHVHTHTQTYKSFASHRFFSFTSICHWSRCNLKRWYLMMIWFWLWWWQDLFMMVLMMTWCWCWFDYFMMLMMETSQT